MSKKSKMHMGRLAEMGCICCDMLGQSQQGKTFVHHLREGVGMAQRQSDFIAIPLCYDCHQGANGIHGDRTYLKLLKCGELDLLAATLEKLL